MSIIVKGVNLPSSCTECDFVKRENWSEYFDRDAQIVTTLYGCIYKPNNVEDDDEWIKFSEADKKRRQWCPLGELPEHHGRLIDADVLLRESFADGAYGYVSTKQIYDAPTIVEAE